MNQINFNNIIETLKVKENKKDNKSKHWQYFINNKFENIEFASLENFRNNSLSDGLDNSRLMDKNYLTKCLDVFKLDIKKFDYKFEDIIKRFDDKNIGNNNIFLKHDKYFIDFIQLYHAKLYILIEKLILAKSRKIKNVLEIGAGYGNLAKMLLLDNNFKYFFIDLPENLLLQIYFLNINFPQLRIYVNQDNSFNNKDLNNYDLFFFTPNDIFKISNNVNFDLIINCSSFMEMEKKSIKEYFELIQKNLNLEGYFFNNNRYFKDSAGQKIRLCEYPYDDFWAVIYSDVFFDFRRLHSLITQRTNDKKSEIKKTLKQIKNLSKNHEYPRFIPVEAMKVIRNLKKKLNLT